MVPASSCKVLAISQSSWTLSYQNCHVILHDKNGSFTCPGDVWEEGNSFWEAWDALTRLRREGADLNCVAFAPCGGYVILHDENGSLASPGGDWEEGNSFWQAWKALTRDLKCIAFAPCAGHVILYGGSAYPS